MNSEIVKEVFKGGMGMVALVGIMGILYTVVKDDTAERAFLREHMQRQTDAIERMVRIYSGEEPVNPR